jgi:hypothetical protein
MGSLTGWIYVDTSTSDIGGYVNTAKAAVARDIKLPPGYYLKWTGQYELLERVRERLTYILPLTIGIVFVILYLNFNGAAQTLLVMTGVPFAAVGAIWMLYADEHGVCYRRPGRGRWHSTGSAPEGQVARCPIRRAAGAGCRREDGGAAALRGPHLPGGGGDVVRQSESVAQPACLKRRSRRELRSTDTLDRLMAALARTGDRSQPVSGYSAPAAIGMPIAL